MVVAEPRPGSKLDSETDFQGPRSVGGTHAVLSTLFPS